MCAYGAVLIFTASLSNVLPQIDIGIAHLSVYRMLLLISPLVFLAEYRKGNTAIKKNVDFHPMLVYSVWFLYSLVTLFWVKDLKNWIRAEFFMAVGVWIIFLFYSKVWISKDFLVIFKAFLLAVAIHNCIGWYELFSHNYLFAPIEKVEYMVSRKSFYAISGLGNLNDYAFLMFFGACIGIWGYQVFDTKKSKILAVLIACSCSIHIFLSQSRGCGIALMIGLAVQFWFSNSKRMRVKGMVALTGLVMFLILLNPEAFLSVARKAKEQFSFMVDKKSLNSEAVRINLLKNGWTYLIRTFWFGVGSGNMEYWQEYFPVYNVRGIYNVHNWWFEILYNYGIGIFTIYMFMYIDILKLFYQKLKRSKNHFNKYTSVLFFSIMGGFVVGAVSSSSLFSTEWLWIFWALIIGFYSYLKQSREDEIIMPRL